MDPRRHFADEPDLRELREAYSIRVADPQNALMRFRALADRSSKMAMIYVAEMYSKGIAVAVDHAQEEAWCQRAAQAGSALAYFGLAKINIRRRDFAKAADACRAGADLDDAPCIYLLATLHLYGMGVPKDVKQGMLLLERAATQGLIYARMRLGGMLIRGYSGFFQRFRGVWLSVSGTIAAFVIAWRDPKDERLAGHRF
jgi:TPR repeat protein